jgi:hypothetical protein
MNALMLSYALSGAAGLRAPLTLLALSIAVYTGHLHPGHALDWLGSPWVIALAAGMTLVDFVADKIPGVDHAMHAVHTVLAPIIGGMAALSGQTGDHSAATVVALLGAGNALLVHSARTGTRVASTATTAGLANPVVSFIEGGTATVLIVLAFVAPVVAAVLLALITLQIVRFVRWLAKRRTVDAGTH